MADVIIYREIGWSHVLNQYVFYPIYKGGIIVALGTVAAGVFTNSTTFWEAIHKVFIVLNNIFLSLMLSIIVMCTS